MGLIFAKTCQNDLLYYAENLPIELYQIGQWGNQFRTGKQAQIDIAASSIDENEFIRCISLKSGGRQ